jgi:hypothetical protein
MSDKVEFAQLVAGGSDGGGFQLAQTLRTEFIDSDPDDVAMTADAAGNRVTITSSGSPMTVRQVEAELDILILGE